MQAVRALLLMWTDADTLAVLILQLRRTHCLPDDVVGTVLLQVRCISLAHALCLTEARAVVVGYRFPLQLQVLPSPESVYKNFYYLSEAVESDGDLQITINARSHWRATDGRDLCYKASVALADVSMSLASDRQSVKMSDARVHLVTNALSLGQLTDDFLRTISRLRLRAAFDARGDMQVVDVDESMAYGFCVCIRYKAQHDVVTSI
jgi:hypothetical protein